VDVHVDAPVDDGDDAVSVAGSDMDYGYLDPIAVEGEDLVSGVGGSYSVRHLRWFRVSDNLEGIVNGWPKRLKSGRGLFTVVNAHNTLTTDTPLFNIYLQTHGTKPPTHPEFFEARVDKATDAHGVTWDQFEIRSLVDTLSDYDKPLTDVINYGRNVGGVRTARVYLATVSFSGRSREGGPPVSWIHLYARFPVADIFTSECDTMNKSTCNLGGTGGVGNDPSCAWLEADEMEHHPRARLQALQDWDTEALETELMEQSDWLQVSSLRRHLEAINADDTSAEEVAEASMDIEDMFAAAIRKVKVELGVVLNQGGQCKTVVWQMGDRVEALWHKSAERVWGLGRIIDVDMNKWPGAYTVRFDEGRHYVPPGTSLHLTPATTNNYWGTEQPNTTAAQIRRVDEDVEDDEQGASGQAPFHAGFSGVTFHGLHGHTAGAPLTVDVQEWEEGADPESLIHFQPLAPSGSVDVTTTSIDRWLQDAQAEAVANEPRCREQNSEEDCEAVFGCTYFHPHGYTFGPGRSCRPTRTVFTGTPNGVTHALKEQQAKTGGYMRTFWPDIFRGYERREDGSFSRIADAGPVGAGAAAPPVDEDGFDDHEFEEVF